MADALKETLAVFETHWENYLEELKTLIRIPSVSFEGFPESELKRSAQSVGDFMKRVGLENVEVIDFPGAHPYAYGEWLKAPGKPTLVLYAHHDVQPPGRDEKWDSPAFEPTIREAQGGKRMFARGAADDKAGVLVHLAAIGSYLKATGSLPVNVKVLIEGEEEIGSEHLPDFLKKYQKKLSADGIVLTDTTNLDSGTPALTIALRGIVAVEVEVRALRGSVHSGMWGGPVPDPVMGLSKMLATLVDNEGRIAIEGVREMVPPLTPDEEKRMRALPYSESEFREQVGLMPGVQILQEGPSPVAQIWRYPSLTVTAIQASSRAQPSNIINDSAWAKVSIRVVGGMDAQKVSELLQKHLKAQVPWGLELKLTAEGVAPAWSCQPSGKLYEGAARALKKGYGKDVAYIGCGGSIPFVGPFAEALGGVPAVLVGVEDPYTQAHGENESVLLSDLKKACLSEIYLFDEIGRGL